MNFLFRNNTTGERSSPKLFVKGLDHSISDGASLYVHASPLQPVYEYVYPDKFASIWNPERITQLMEKVDWLSFCGHTHHPCAISSTLKCIYPERVGYTLELNPEEKYIINVGSVGQPRGTETIVHAICFSMRKIIR